MTLPFSQHIDGNGRVLQSTPYPANATPVNAASGNKAAAIASAALAAAANKTTYLSGFDVTGSGATAASVVNLTITDGTWTLTYALAVVAGATLQNEPLAIHFEPPLAASVEDTAITVSCPSLGSGNTNNCVNAYGYQL